LCVCPPFKVCCSIVEKSEVESPRLQSRLRHEDSFLTSSRFKSTGVNRVVILAVVPDIGEKHWHMRELLAKMKYYRVSSILGLETLVCTDMKMVLCMCGQQTASSSFPCPYCYKAKKDFRNIGLRAKERTFQGNHEYALEWASEEKRDRSKLANFYN
jgi:glutaredoxin